MTEDQTRRLEAAIVNWEAAHEWHAAQYSKETEYLTYTYGSVRSAPDVLRRDLLRIGDKMRAAREFLAVLVHIRDGET